MQTSTPVTSLKLAERFCSVQGEGQYVGTKMFFIRLAGCNVGKYEYDPIHQRGAKMENVVNLNVLDEQLAIAKKHSVCTTATGQRFLCDTDYHATSDTPFAALLQEWHESGANFINFTGGEPLLWQREISKFIEYIQDRGDNPHVHVETSGTLAIWSNVFDYVTCSPKQGFLMRNCALISQYKFVATSVDDLRKIAAFQAQHNIYDFPIYVSPVAPVSFVGGVETIHAMMNYTRLANELTEHPDWQPNWRLNLQIHKILGVR
jgi:organic radical activating enzyme